MLKIFNRSSSNIKDEAIDTDSVYYQDNSNEFYDEYYDDLISSGAIGFVAGIYHKQLENGHDKKYPLCLELGAGSGQHFKFVKHDFDVYISSDLRTPKAHLDLMEDSRVKFQVLDAQELSAIESESIDRLIVTCVLPHLSDPEAALKEWRRVLKPGGVLDVYVPCEPSILLDIAQRLTTKRKVEKLGLKYEKIRYRGHRNHYPYLKMLLESTFNSENIKVKHFPIGIRYWQFSLWSTFRITKST